MKKIIFVHLLNDFSGSPRVLADILTICDEKNIQYDLYTNSVDGGILNKFKEKITVIPYHRSNNKYITLFYFLFSQIVLFLKLLKYRKENIVFYANTMLPFGVGIAGKLLKKNVVYHIHEKNIRPQILKKNLRFIISKTAYKTIYVSKSLLESEKFKKVPAKLVYNGINLEFENNVKKIRYSKKNDGKFNVLMIASLKKYKGIDQFVEIASLFVKNKKITFSLVVNVDQYEINSYFNNTTIPNNLTIYPKSNEILTYYKESSLVMNLSDQKTCVETFGLTLLEAMSCGVPVIAPQVGGPAEIVRDKIDGYLIDSKNLKKIAEHITNLEQDNELYLSLSKNCLQRAEEFSNKVFKKNILEELSNIL